MFRYSASAVIATAVAVPTHQCETDNVYVEDTDQDRNHPRSFAMGAYDSAAPEQMACLSSEGTYILTAAGPGSNTYYVDSVSTGWSPSRLLWFDRPRLDAAFHFATPELATDLADGQAWSCLNGASPYVSVYPDVEWLELNTIIQSGFPLCPSDPGLTFYILGISAY